MALIARAGAESRGAAIGEFAVTNTAENKGTAAAINTTVPRKVKVGGEEKGGTACFEIAANGAERATHAPNWFTGVKERWYYYRVAVKKTGNVAATRPIIRFYQTEGELMGSVEVTAASKLLFKNGAGTEVASVENGLNETGMENQGGYHIIEGGFWVGIEAGKCKGRYWCDGVEIHKNEATYTMAKANNPPAGIRVGFMAAEVAGPVLFFDDLAVNDDQGAANNSNLGTGGVIAHLNPESDKGRTGFIGGASGTTELFKAVDRPPEGVANASATNTSQIKDATSSTTDFYEATVATYTSIGVGSNDLVNCLRVFAFGGRTTGNVKFALKGVSNPEVTEVEVEATTTAEAFATGWRVYTSGAVNEPAPTLGTGPVIKIRKAQASTNIVQCCYLTLQVEWTPKAAPAANNYLAMLL